MRIRRRTLVLIAAGITLAIGGIVAIAAGWLLKTQSGRNFVRARVEQVLRNRLHGRGVYIGKFTESLLGSLTVDSIEIRDADDSVLVATGQIHLRYDLVDLWNSRIALQRLVIEHPYVHLRRDSAGVWNYKKVLGQGGASGPRSPGRHLGDVITADSVTIHGGVFKWTDPWNPPSRLHGAARDSAIAHALARTDADYTRAGRRFVRSRTWRGIQASVPHARLNHPDSAGVAFAIARLDADESDPPFTFRGGRGLVTIANDTVHLGIDAFRLPGSAGSARGTIATKDGLGIAVHVVGDTVSLADIAWLYPTFPKEGGGRVALDIRKGLKSDLTEYVLTQMDVATTRSRLRGAMTFGVGGPLLAITNVDVVLAPVDFKLFEQFSGKPLGLPWAGQLTGMVRGRGGPLNRFFVDTAAIDFADANVPGVVNQFHGRGELDIVTVALTAFHDFALHVGRFDLRTARALDTAFAPLKGWVSGTARLDSVWTDIRFRDADIRYAVDSAPTSRFTGMGRVTVGESELTYDLALVADPISLDALAVSYPKMPVRGAFSGPFTVRGTLGNLAVTGDVTGEGGRLVADLRLDDVPPTYRVSGTLRLAGVDPARLFVDAKQWQGKLTGSIDADVRGDSLANLEGGLRITLSGSELGGARIYGARTALTFADGVVRTDSVVVRSTVGDFRGSGGLGLSANRRDSLVIAVQMDSLGGLRPWLAPRTDTLAVDSLAGAVTGAVRLAGNVDSLDARVELHATDLVVGTTTAAQVTVTAAITDLLRRRVGTIALVADSANAGGVQLARATIDARLTGGDTARVGAHLQSATGPVIDAGANVAWDSVGVRADVDSLQLMIGDNRWRLAHAARLVTSRDAITIDTLDLRSSGAARIVLAAVLPNEGAVSGSFRADSFPLGDIGQLFQVPLPLGGDANVVVNLGGTRDAPTLDFRMAARNAQVGDTRVEGLQGSGKYANRVLTAGIEYRRNGASVLRGDAELPVDLTLRPVAKRLLDQPLKGSLVADTTDLSVIEAFSNAFTRASGRLDVHLTLDGTWETPRVRGGLAIMNGAFTLARLGRTRYDHVFARIGFFGDSIAVDTLSAHSGSAARSIAHASGWLKIEDLHDPAFNFTVIADQFEAIDQEHVAKLEVSTERGSPFRIVGRRSGSTLTGAATFNGNIFIPEVAKKNVIALDDPQYFRLVDTTALATRRLLPPATSAIVKNMFVNGVTVTAGDNLWLRSQEANVKLSGELKVTQGFSQARGQALLGLDGILTAEQGTYRLNAGLLQRSFDVENGGTVQFFGDPDINPTIDISAITTVGQYDPRDARPNTRIRVNIRGTLSSLTAQFSSPDVASLSQADLLSYLVTGAPSFDIGGRASDYTSTAARIGLSSLGAVLGSKWSGGFFDVVEVTTAGLQGGYTGNTKTVGAGILSATRAGVGKQFGSFFFHLDAGLCSIGQGSFDPVEFASAVGAKVDWRFPHSMSMSVGLDPPTSASLCAPGGGARGFVPTPRQLGIDFFRIWRF